MPPRSPGITHLPRHALPVLVFLLPWARQRPLRMASQVAGPSNYATRRHMAQLAVKYADETGGSVGDRGRADDGRRAELDYWVPTTQDRKGKGKAAPMSVDCSHHYQHVPGGELASSGNFEPCPSRLHASEQIGDDLQLSSAGRPRPLASESSTSHQATMPAEGQTTSSRTISRPPNPRNLLARMQTDSSYLTLENGIRLARYAERVSDLRVAREVKDMLARTRLAPLNWTSSAATPGRRTRRQRNPVIAASTPYDARFANGTLAGQSPDGLEGCLAPPATPKRKRPHINQKMAHLWPPKTAHVNSRTTVDTYLSHLHHSLIPGSISPRPTLQDALLTLESLEPVPTGAHIRAVLHLFLAYPSPECFSSPRLTNGYWAREIIGQIEHLAARYPQFQPGHQALLLSLVPYLRDIRTVRSPRGTRSSIMRILGHFEARWGRQPTMETWRHIGRWASRARDEKLAQLAWDGWWRERDKQERGELAGSWNILRHESAPSQERRALESPSAAASAAAFVFERRGKLLQRWRSVVNKFVAHGWLVHTETGEQVRLNYNIRRLRWRAPPGESDKGREAD